MKNKINFLLPRLVGATILVGLISIVIATVFKLLFGLALIAGIARIAAGRRSKFLKENEQLAFSPIKNFQEPTNVFGRNQSISTIVPIN